MRISTGALLAMSLPIAAGVLVATPAASAVAHGPTCKTLVASVTVSPALPKLGSKTVVTATVSTIGRIGGCAGGGVTGAAFTDAYRYKGNCSTFLTGKGGVTTPGPSSLSWSNGRASTATTSARLVSAPGKTPVILELSSRITKGQFAGTSASGDVRATSPNGTCKARGLSRATLAGSGSFTFK